MKDILSPQHIKSSDIAFAVVVLAAYFVLFSASSFTTSFNLPMILLIIVLGLIYLSVGIYGSHYIDSHPSLRLNVAYLTFLILLGGIISYLGKGNTWLLLLPMVGAAVEILPGGWAVLVCGLIWIIDILPLGLLYGTDAMGTWAMPILAAVVFVAMFTQISVSERNARQQLARAHQDLRSYAAQVKELTVVQERNRMAREIHDGLGHYLTAINIQIKAAQAVLAQDPALSQEALKNAQTLTQEALADVRRSVSALREDPSSGRPLPETLEHLLDEVRAGGIQAALAIRGVTRPLPAQVEFTLYRTAQESLTNVRKHAKASQVQMNLDYLEKSIRLVISDNGIGAAQTSGGFGLVGLRERVELVGGKLLIESIPGLGFTITADLPTL